MDELKGFVPVIVGLFIGFAIIMAFGGAISWLLGNPFVLIAVVALLGAAAYFWMKRRRARTMV